MNETLSPAVAFCIQAFDRMHWDEKVSNYRKRHSDLSHIAAQNEVAALNEDRARQVIAERQADLARAQAAELDAEADRAWRAKNYQLTMDDV